MHNTENKSDVLNQELTLPCGIDIPNRLAKAATSEGLADAHNRATEQHAQLYRRWSKGGSGLLITGNIMVDRRYMERPGNVAIDQNEGIDRLKEWAKAGTTAGNQLWLQLNHAGRQTPKHISEEPVAPSPVSLDLGGGFAQPRMLLDTEIKEIIGRFARGANIAKEAGFTGVEIHAAHGYLLSQFLSPHVNRRDDRWGGSLQNRARLLIETVQAVRKEVGPQFPVAVKLNSADFQKNGFTAEECRQVAAWLDQEEVDLLEITGGTYERMAFYEGNNSHNSDNTEKPDRESTRKREAYFLDYATNVRDTISMPLMVTGGFRRRQTMRKALTQNETDIIGLARPLCIKPDLPHQLLEGNTEEAPTYEQELRLGPWLLGPDSPFDTVRKINTMGKASWFGLQVMRLGQGKNPNLDMSLLKALFQYQRNEYKAAEAMAETS